MDRCDAMNHDSLAVVGTELWPYCDIGVDCVMWSHAADVNWSALKRIRHECAFGVRGWP